MPQPDTPDAADRHDRVRAALAALGDATAAQLAAHAGLPYSSTTPILRALHADGTAARRPGPGRSTRWTLTPTARPAGDTPQPPATPSSVSAAPDAVESPPSDGLRRADTPVREKGALRAEVLALLRSHPDRCYKVSEICKLLDRAHDPATARKVGGGAVANALHKLAGDGHVEQIIDRPATFQATTS